jgi:hypothetical protein
MATLERFPMFLSQKQHNYLLDGLYHYRDNTPLKTKLLAVTSIFQQVHSASLFQCHSLASNSMGDFDLSDYTYLG